MALSREIISNVECGFNEASFSWSNDELKILEEAQEYHARMIEKVANAKGKGPVELPKKSTKRKLEICLKKKKERTQK